MDGARQQHGCGRVSTVPGEYAHGESEDVLRAKARALIATARVPRELPTRRWGGPGIGVPCMVCGVAVEQHQTGIELELASDVGDGGANHHFHVRCLAVLEHELRLGGADGSRSKPRTTEALPANRFISGQAPEAT